MNGNSKREMFASHNKAGGGSGKEWLYFHFSGTQNGQVTSNVTKPAKTGIPMNDLAAFEQLMRRHNRALYRTARSIVKDDTEAEDVLQEAYLLAFRGLQGFRGESSMSTWLTRIVINEAIGRTRRRSADIIQLDGETVMDEHEEQPDQALLRSQARRLIERKIDGLPDAFRTVFVLRALEEMTVEETAACIGIPEATVRTRYFRARGLLREALSRELDVALEDAFAFDGARCDRIVANVLERLKN